MLSGNNQKVKYLRRMANRRFREREGKFFIEGARFVEEAIASSFHVEMLVFCGNGGGSGLYPALEEKAAAKGVPCFEIENRLFSELADTVTPQGVIAVAGRRWERLADLKTTVSWLLVLADGVKDPGNLGTIVRSADAAGADGVILLKGTADIFNPKALRATMGSIFHIPVIQNVSVAQTRDFLKDQGIKLIAGTPGRGQAIYNCDLTGSIALLAGGEAVGPQAKTLAAAEEYAQIPMPGKAESLNVAVSAGIMLYEAVRQRNAF